MASSGMISLPSNMKSKLNRQQRQVYDYIKANPGCTVREIHRNIYPGVDKVSARLSEIEAAGVEIERLGRNQYREMQYRIGKPLTKRVQEVEIVDGVARVTYKEVPV